MNRPMSAALGGVVVLAGVLGVAPAARGQAIIHNTTTVKLGVDRFGQLNIPGTVPSYVLGTTAVGLRFMPTGIGGLESESTSHGCFCEGWGIKGTTPAFSARANNAWGVAGLVSNSFTSTGSTAVADCSTVGGELRIVHDFRPSASPNLYEVLVTVTNTSTGTINGIVYRRNMDWDVEPTAFTEFTTIDTYPTPGGPLPANVLLTSEDGFVDSDPNVAPTLTFCGPIFVDCGPSDHGAHFDLDLGNLGAGASTTFKIYYGAAPDEPSALAALGVVNAQFYSFGQPDLAPPADHGRPNTFIFAFGGALFGDGCTTPPQNMVAWLPFDENAGPTVTNNSLHPTADGTLSGGAWLGSPGKVGNAVCFDQGQVDVPHYPALFLDGDITIDAWVRVQPQGGAWKHTIVDKRQFVGALWRGYWLYVNQTSATTGTLTLEFNDGSGLPNPSLGPVVTLGPWQHVAVTVRRNCGGAGNVCVDFALNGACSPGAPALFLGESGVIGTTAGLRVGDDLVASTGDNWIVGCIDELEIFGRALSCAEIDDIYQADEAGKCKEFCIAEWDRSFYGSQTSITVPLRVCNSTSTVQCYNLSFLPATCPISTGTPSPVGITSSPIPPICVAPGQCSTVWLTIPRPPFVSLGDVSCYTVCMTNLATGEIQCCDGSVQWAQDVIVISWPPILRGDVVVGLDLDFGPIVVGRPIGLPLPLDIDIRLRAVGPDMEPDMTTLSLNGLPPGEPVWWDAHAKPGGTDSLPLIIRALVDDPGQPYWVLLEADLDGDGDLEAVESISLLGHLEDPCAPNESEDFEFHPPGTVCGIEGFIPWQNGNDVCGEVSTEQASSGNRSLKVVGSVGGAAGLGDDTVLPVAGVESGQWTFSVMTYVPTDATGEGALVLLNTYDDVAPPQNSWYSAQVRFRANQNDLLADIGAGATALIKGQWVELRIEIDLDSDLADYFYNGAEFVSDRPWTDGVVPGFPGPARLRAIDFYGGEPATGGTSGMYFDDVRIAAPCELGGGGADCNENGVDDATDIANGTSTDCYNAALGSGSSPDAIPDECQCIADWNRDGTVNSTDVSDFINTFFSDQSSGGASGDINCDGVSNSTDVSDFINLWFSALSGQLPYAGCSI